MSLPTVSFEPAGQIAYLVYTEDVSKTNQGGLLHRKKAAKEVVHHANLTDPKYCLIRLFKLYNSLCPIGQPDKAKTLR